MSKEQIAFWIAGEVKSSAGGGSAIVGQMVSYVGTTPPSKWLICNGDLVSPKIYTDLFILLGTAYGGDGVDTFGLPDLRKRVPIGAFDNTTLNTTMGSGLITLQQDNLPPVSLNIGGNTTMDATGITATSTDLGHTHTVSACPNRSYDAIAGANQWIANAETDLTTTTGKSSDPDNPDYIRTTIADPTHQHAFSGKTDVLGSGTQIDITPASAVVNYIIYAGV